MSQSLTQTPLANRLHIAFFGRRNSGKSSLCNALAGQEVALVSEIAGTTTDPVIKAIELHPLGPCALIDTAGFDDEGPLGILRVEKTRVMLDRVDLAVMVFTAGQTDTTLEEEWLAQLRARKTPIVAAVNKGDLSSKIPLAAAGIPHQLVSAHTGLGIDELREKIVAAAPKDFEISSITGHLVDKGDHVLLVAPQDIQAPKGRLILPQVQTIRDLLDIGAHVSVVTAEGFREALALYHKPPKLIVTDSQVFPLVYGQKPSESLLTSFSVLMARYKGDIGLYLEGAKAVEHLDSKDRVLILEACSHNPLDGDIGRIKIPALLRRKVGPELTVDVCSGSDIPNDMTPYALVVHCGGCMLGRTQVLARISRCREQKIPVTNYGILLAKLEGILEKITV